MRREDQRIPYLRPDIEIVETQLVVMQDRSAIKHGYTTGDGNITLDGYADDGTEDLGAGDWGEMGSAKQGNNMWDE